MHAKLLAHSLLETHSGRQFGGDPIKSRKHEHEGESPTRRHSEFEPQGVGRQGSMGSDCKGLSTAITYREILSKFIMWK